MTRIATDISILVSKKEPAKVSNTIIFCIR